MKFTSTTNLVLNIYFYINAFYFIFDVETDVHILLCFTANLGTLTGFRTQDHGRGGGNQQTHEMTVPNELIGCIIGKGGSKISEIR
jgi:hypothetical protein